MLLAGLAGRDDGGGGGGGCRESEAERMSEDPSGSGAHLAPLARCRRRVALDR